MIFWDNFDAMTTTVICDKCESDMTEIVRDKIKSRVSIYKESLYTLVKLWQIRILKYRISLTILHEVQKPCLKPPFLRKD